VTLAIGVDVGGTKVAAGVVDEVGRIRTKLKRSTPAVSPLRTEQAIADVVTELLASHEVAAILVEEPYILRAENTLGAIAVLDSCSGETANLPLSGYFATTAFVRAHQQALTEFRSVLKQAQTDAVLPGPLRKNLSHDPGMDMQLASLVTLGDYPTSLNAANLQRVASLMFNFEMFTQTLNVSSMVAH